MIFEQNFKYKRYLEIVFGALLVVGISVFAWYQFLKNPAEVFCTMEAKQCPDGSFVGRTGPDCEFAECQANKSQPENNFGNSQMEKAIINYLLTQNYFSWKTTENSHNFCVIKNILPEAKLFPLYLWVYCGEYAIQNGELKQLSGFFGRTKINYPNELSYYDSSRFSYEVPRDGSLQDEDIKRIFPPEGQIGISEVDRKELINKLETSALANILSWERIKQVIANCEVSKAWQNHAREVSVSLKNGQELTAIEPKIDDLFVLIDEAEPRCGRFTVGTE